jgi:hypothetical protein
MSTVDSRVPDKRRLEKEWRKTGVEIGVDEDARRQADHLGMLRRIHCNRIVTLFKS